MGFDSLFVFGNNCCPSSILFHHQNPDLSVFSKSWWFDGFDVSVEVFELLCHTSMVAASERGATGISQRFPTVILKELQRSKTLILSASTENHVESKRLQRIPVISMSGYSTRQILLTENGWNSLIPNSLSQLLAETLGIQFTTNPRRIKSLRISYEKM